MLPTFAAASSAIRCPGCAPASSAVGTSVTSRDCCRTCATGGTNRPRARAQRRRPRNKKVDGSYATGYKPELSERSGDLRMLTESGLHLRALPPKVGVGVARRRREGAEQVRRVRYSGAPIPRALAEEARAAIGKTGGARGADDAPAPAPSAPRRPRVRRDGCRHHHWRCAVHHAARLVDALQVRGCLAEPHDERFGTTNSLRPQDHGLLRLGAPAR